MIPWSGNRGLRRHLGPSIDRIQPHCFSPEYEAGILKLVTAWSAATYPPCNEWPTDGYPLELVAWRTPMISSKRPF
jgi:hypothetical protein